MLLPLKATELKPAHQMREYLLEFAYVVPVFPLFYASWSFVSLLSVPENTFYLNLNFVSSCAFVSIRLSSPSCDDLYTMQCLLSQVGPLGNKCLCKAQTYKTLTFVPIYVKLHSHFQLINWNYYKSPAVYLWGDSLPFFCGDQILIYFNFFL